MKVVSENIRKHREVAKLSTQELAERIVITQDTVAGWENGTAYPDIDTLILIASALNVDVMELIYGEFYASQKAPHDARPGRIKAAVIWSMVFVVFLTSSVLLSVYVDYQNEAPKLDLKAVLIPSTYASGTAALASIAAIWYDYRVSSKLVRICLLCIGIACILFYYVVLLLPYFFKHHIWLYLWFYKRPALFILPGILLTLGAR